MAKKKIKLDKKDFIVGIHTNNKPIILYKGIVPCWYTTGDTLDDYEFYVSIYHAEDENGADKIILCCQAATFNDVYTYGNWTNLEECQAWLDNPTILRYVIQYINK